MFRRPRRLRVSTLAGLALITGLIVAVLTGCGTPSPATSPAAPTVGAPTSPAAASTRSVTFTPFASGASVGPAAPITATCWTTSIADPAADTYRCLAKNQILDPCFVAPSTQAPRSQTVLACFADPWAVGVQIVVKGALPKAEVTSAPNPWALQLAYGVRCVSLTGTVRTVGQLNLTYHCATAGSAGLLPAAKPGAERAVEYSATATGALQQVAVETLWRG